MLAKEEIDEEAVFKLLQKTPLGYPSDLGKEDKLSDAMKGKIALFLAKNYMTEVDATHCTPLPKDKFLLPFDPTEKDAFVKV